MKINLHLLIKGAFQNWTEFKWLCNSIPYSKAFQRPFPNFRDLSNLMKVLLLFQAVRMWHLIQIVPNFRLISLEKKRVSSDIDIADACLLGFGNDQNLRWQIWKIFITLKLNKSKKHFHSVQCRKNCERWSMKKDGCGFNFSRGHIVVDTLLSLWICLLAAKYP